MFQSLNQASKTLPASGSPPGGPPSGCGREFAEEAAVGLLGCYRKGEAEDPLVFHAGLVAILSRYPASVVEVVVHPATGLPGRLKWLPALAEVREACEREATKQHNAAARAAPRQARRLETHKPPAEERARIVQRVEPLGIEAAIRQRALETLKVMAAGAGVTEAEVLALPDRPLVAAE